MNNNEVFIYYCVFTRILDNLNFFIYGQWFIYREDDRVIFIGKAQIAYSPIIGYTYVCILLNTVIFFFKQRNNNIKFKNIHS